MSSPMRFPTGDAKSLPWKWSGASGRRRRSSTPNTTGQPRSQRPDRFSRHYADTAALAKHPTASKAIDQHDLRDRVVEWKSQFFGSSWANYDQAKPGTFRLVPPPERLPALRRDYQAMRDMYLSEPASFDDILATLADLENRINHAGGG